MSNKDIMAPMVSQIRIQKWGILHSNQRGIKSEISKRAIVALEYRVDLSRLDVIELDKSNNFNVFEFKFSIS